MKNLDVLLRIRGDACLILNYAAQLALCVSGAACVLEVEDLSAELAQDCIGAERVIAVSVQRVETQSADWSAAMAFERTRAETILMTDYSVAACRV